MKLVIPIVIIALIVIIAAAFLFFAHPSHLECREQVCTIVQGAGQDQCSPEGSSCGIEPLPQICSPSSTEPCVTGLQGICSSGIKVCNSEGTAYGPCTAELPQTELCSDALDNDCDGSSDCNDPDCASSPPCLPPVINQSVQPNQTTNATLPLWPNRPPTTPVMSESPDPVIAGANITFVATWSDPNGNEARLLICRSGSISNGNCPGGKWCASPLSLSPSQCSYKTTTLDKGIRSYYAYECDIQGSCSSYSAGSFTVQTASANSSNGSS